MPEAAAIRSPAHNPAHSPARGEGLAEALAEHRSAEDPAHADLRHTAPAPLNPGPRDSAHGALGHRNPVRVDHLAVANPVQADPGPREPALADLRHVYPAPLNPGPQELALVNLGGERRRRGRRVIRRWAGAWTPRCRTRWAAGEVWSSGLRRVAPPSMPTKRCLPPVGCRSSGLLCVSACRSGRGDSRTAVGKPRASNPG